VVEIYHFKGTRMNRETILIVDDDPKMIKLVQSNLKARGYNTLIANDGMEALDIVEKNTPDLVILDLLMPKMDGREVCRRLRQWTDIPIIVLSALGQVYDKVTCFELGADDYLVKPFAIDELLVRIKALLNRFRKQQNTLNIPSIKKGNLEINFSSGIVSLSGKQVRLTNIEFKLLTEFALNQGKILTHEHLLNKVWGLEFQYEKEYLRVYVSRLRNKLHSSELNPLIDTVPGIGYQFI
jgi:two-component system KDP operon response regulator KdpE